MTILRNDFHHTEYRTTKSLREVRDLERKAPWNRTDAERAWIRRVRKTLCGVDGCVCSDDTGMRGSQRQEG